MKKAETFYVNMTRYILYNDYKKQKKSSGFFMDIQIEQQNMKHFTISLAVQG